MQFYDRNTVQREATQAQTAGNRRKAIKLFTEIASHDGPDPWVETKLAVLFAELERHDEARKHFIEAALLYARRGFETKAVGVYRQALDFLPLDLAFWDAIANEQLSRGRTADAVSTLRKARKTFHQPEYRHVAIYLLKRQLALEPENWKEAFALGRLLRQDLRRAEAQAVYEYLLRVRDRTILRRARFALFVMSPTPPAAWRYARAVLRAR